MHRHESMPAFTRVCMLAHTQAGMPAHFRAHVCMHRHICTYMHTTTCMHTDMETYTHTHAHIQGNLHVYTSAGICAVQKKNWPRNQGNRTLNSLFRGVFLSIHRPQFPFVQTASRKMVSDIHTQHFHTSTYGVLQMWQSCKGIVLRMKEIKATYAKKVLSAMI